MSILEKNKTYSMEKINPPLNLDIFDYMGGCQITYANPDEEANKKYFFLAGGMN